MKVKANNGKTYDVAAAPPGKEHTVRFNDEVVGAFVLDDDRTRITRATAHASDKLLREIADKFVDLGGGPMGIA